MNKKKEMQKKLMKGSNVWKKRGGKGAFCDVKFALK